MNPNSLDTNSQPILDEIALKPRTTNFSSTLSAELGYEIDPTSESNQVPEPIETDRAALDKVRKRIERLSHGEEETIPDPYEATDRMDSARAFFEKMGIPIGPDDSISADLTPEQIASLKQWSNETFVDSIHMPDEDTFYRKVLLGISLWRQRNGQSINYLLGKGVGLEVSIRGQVRGRTKKPFFFSYRSHSDFELYNVDYPHDAQGGDKSGKSPYPKAFRAIFGSQEYFPPSRTKGLRNIPEGLLTETAEVVDLGGLQVLVPQLELQFLDKWEKSGFKNRTEGTDAEILARQYVLNIERLHEYLDRFVIQPEVANLRTSSRFDPQWHFDRLSRRIAFTREKLVEGGIVNPPLEQVLAELNREMGELFKIPGHIDAYISGVRLRLWRDLTSEQVGAEDEIIDGELVKAITELMQTDQQQIIANLRNKHTQLDDLLSMTSL